MTLGIYGTGGSGKELLEMVERFPALSERWSEIVFLDDTQEVGTFRGHRRMPLAAFAALFTKMSAEVVIAVGEPYYRLRMAEKVAEVGFSLATIIHPLAHVSPSAKLGRGVVVRLGSVISADAIVGDNVWIQTYVTIGHDVHVGAHTQISSYVMLAGAVRVGQTVFLGIQSAVREELDIGDDAIVSMGAIVMRPVLAKQVVSGNPAHVVMMNTSRRVFKSARHAANAASHRLVAQEEGTISAAPLAVPAELVARVREVLRAQIPELDFSASRTMADDGLLDSLTMTRILETFKTHFQVEIPYERITPERFNSLETLAALLQEVGVQVAAASVPMQSTLVASFFEQAARYPSRLAVGSRWERLTYGEVRRRVLNAALRLSTQVGIVAGDRVMLAGVARADYPVALLALQYLGAITIPYDRRMKAETLASLVAYVQPKAVLTGEAMAVEGAPCFLLADLMRDDAEPSQPVARAVRRAEEIAEMLFTTGTTGTPKAVQLSSRAIYAIMRNTRDGIGLQPSDVVLIPLPLNHSVGMRVLRTALSIGCGVVLQEGLAFAQELEHNLVDFACTGLVVVPTAVELLRRQMGSRFAQVLGRLRYLEFGAGSLSVAMKQRLVAELPQVKMFNTWGSSETGGALFLEFSAFPDKLDTVGRPVAGVKFGTVSEGGGWGLARTMQTAARMALAGDMRMSGYYKLPQETADALQGEWLVTNDLAYLDAEGFVHLLGRVDDILNVGGEKVAPIQVETLAEACAGVRAAACIGVADHAFGQVPVLFYEADSSFAEVTLQRFMRETAEWYQCPQAYVRLEALPRNAMAKIDRRALRALWKERNGDAAPRD